MIYGDITTLRMMAASIKRSREEMAVERAILGIDGNCGFALLGENLQVGESEFVEIKHPGCKQSMEAACYEALTKLRERLPDREITYALDESYPR